MLSLRERDADGSQAEDVESGSEFDLSMDMEPNVALGSFGPCVRKGETDFEKGAVSTP